MAKGGAVVAFALVPLRESGKDRGDLCVCSSATGLFQRRIAGILIGAVALCIGYTGACSSAQLTFALLTWLLPPP